MKKLRLKNEKLQRFVDKYFNTNDKKFGRNVAIAAALLIGLIGGLIWTAKTIVTNSKKTASVVEENNYYLTETTPQASPIAQGDFDVYGELEAYQLDKNMSDTTVDDITQEVMNNIDRAGYSVSEEVRKEMYSEISRILSQELENRSITAADLSDDIWKKIEDRVVDIYKENQKGLDADKSLEDTFRKLIASDLENLSSRIKNSDDNIANNSTKITESNKKIDSQGKQIDENGKQIDAQGKLIDENGKQIDAQGKQIDENGKQINAQGKLIEETSSKLADTDAKLGNTQSSLADTNKKVDGINSALADATSDYNKKIGDLNTSFEDKMKALSDQVNALNSTVTNNYDTLSGQISSALGNYATVTYDNVGNPYIWVDNNHNGEPDWNGGADTLLPFKRKVYSEDFTHQHFGEGPWTCYDLAVYRDVGGMTFLSRYDYTCTRQEGELVAHFDIYMWPNGDGTYSLIKKVSNNKWRCGCYFKSDDGYIGNGTYPDYIYIASPGDEFDVYIMEYTDPSGTDRKYFYERFARFRVGEGFITKIK